MSTLVSLPGTSAAPDYQSLDRPLNFTAAAAKVHATMNQRVRDYYQKIQQFFKGGLPQEVQPPEYQ